MNNWVSNPSFRIPINKSIWKIIDFIFPPTCVGCGEVGEMLCNDCSKQIKKIDQNYQILPKTDSPNTVKSYSTPTLNAIYSYALYSPPISSAIKKFKYRRDIGMSNLLANFLLELYNKNKMDIDMVVPVPLNKNRNKQRGFNQSYFLALPFSLEIRKPLCKQSLRRVRDTNSQVGLNREERSLNLTGAFEADHKLVNGKNILLIDDVTTTGATLEACAQALKSAGAMDIFAFTVALAMQTQFGFSDSEFGSTTA